MNIPLKFSCHLKFKSVKLFHFIKILSQLTVNKLINVSDIHRLQTFTSSLKTVNLFDLNMSQALVVFYHVENAVRLETAQLTLQRFAVYILSIDRFELHFLEQLSEMIEFNFHAFVANVLDVAVELLNRVSVVVAAVAFQLRDIVVVVSGGRIDDVFKFVFVSKTA